MTVRHALLITSASSVPLPSLLSCQCIVQLHNCAVIARTLGPNLGRGLVRLAPVLARHASQSLGTWQTGDSHSRGGYLLLVTGQ